MRRLPASLVRKSSGPLGLCLASVLLLLSGRAGAEIYQWTDDAGRLHFSQSIHDVPADQREAARQGAAERHKRDPLQVYGRTSGAASGTPSDDPGPASLPSAAGGTVMHIPFERNGTLMQVEVLLNGRVKAPFFIDTGASGVSIPWSVAQKLGLQITPDTPRIEVSTANGIVSEPIVKIQSVQLGPARVSDLAAAVSGSMDVGLLGGAFFNNFVYQVDAAAGVITLKPNERVRGGLDQKQWRARFDAIRGPLAQLESYLEKGGFTDESRVKELERHRDELRASLDELEREANQAGVPRGWRQ